MDQEQTFTMPWSVPREQWERARAAMANHGRGSAYDRRGLGRYYLLYGDVDFVYGETPFYGSSYGANGINVSLIDLALALADAYLKHNFAPGATAKYQQLDDELEIQFSGEGEDVRITASDRPNAVVIPRSAFEHGVLTFLRGLTGAIAAQLSGALDWESLAPLKEMAARFGVN